jgi:hypothetical protein
MEGEMESVRRVLSMPGRVTVVVAVSLTVSAGLLVPLGPVAYAWPATSGGKGVVEETKAEPTTLAITLQGEGGTTSGADVTVADRTRVSASVALSGANAPTARGTVSYAVYSDGGCTNEVAWAGPRLIRRSTESPPMRLAPGKYYWQATYSGDAKDRASASACGAAIEIVEGGDPPACMNVSGESRLLTEEGHLTFRNDLTTDLGAEQRLVASWTGGHRLRLTKLLEASCVAGTAGSRFHGIGEAKLDGKPGYIVHFNIRVASNGEEAVRIHVRNERHERVLDLAGSPEAGSEVID